MTEYEEFDALLEGIETDDTDQQIKDLEEQLSDLDKQIEQAKLALKENRAYKLTKTGVKVLVAGAVYDTTFNFVNTFASENRSEAATLGVGLASFFVSNALVGVAVNEADRQMTLVAEFLVDTKYRVKEMFDKGTDFSSLRQAMVDEIKETSEELARQRKAIFK